MLGTSHFRHRTTLAGPWWQHAVLHRGPSCDIPNVAFPPNHVVGGSHGYCFEAEARQTNYLPQS